MGVTFGQGGCIIVLPPLPAEKQAYALARYSRSPDTIADSLRWVQDHSAERFWEKFYFEYGHASIADLGHLAICIEGLSDLAASAVLDDSLLDAQAKSTRYQDFSTVPLVFPCNDAEARLVFQQAATELLTAYREVFAVERRALVKAHPRPATMDPERYERTLSARALDVARYLLPMATSTNVGLVMSVRTLERTIGRLLASDYPEVQELGEALIKACQEPPAQFLAELFGQTTSIEPLAPTLARRAKLQNYAGIIREQAQFELHAIPDTILPVAIRGGIQQAVGTVGTLDLLPAHELPDEMLATLFYSRTNMSYRDCLGVVSGLCLARRDGILYRLIGKTEPQQDPPRELQAGYHFIFDIQMDYGGWRDLHRHRRCVQIAQRIDLAASSALPPVTADPGTPARLREAGERAQMAVSKLANLAGDEAAHYLLPFAHQVRCLFKMDFAQLQYICRLRTSPKGHDSYRSIAFAMAKAIWEKEPSLANFVVATGPEQRDPLVR
ncbi:MAG: FAD-dependent thymidylate synthase [Cyanobacteria bacterium NC_groundwater_1444_Ag_S-0.65um_54_12]|nr:FAD-dependent thymidylate synthase [Cyanobacteria bacterium NC_groundwater_1444_Ag_S-0.65um_54_12]